MEFFLIYLYVALEEVVHSDGFGAIIVIVAILGIFLPIMVRFVGYTELKGADDLKKILGRITTVSTIVLFVAMITSVAVPSKQGMAWVIGGYTAYSLTQNEEAQTLPDNLLRAMNSVLEDVYEEEAEEKVLTD